MEANVLTAIVAAGVVFVGYELHRGNELRRTELAGKPDPNRVDEILRANFPHLLAVFSRDYRPKLVEWISTYLDVAAEVNRQQKILTKHPNVWLDYPDNPPSWGQCRWGLDKQIREEWHNAVKDDKDDGKCEARYWRLQRFRKLSEKFVVLARERTVLTDAEIAFILYDKWRELQPDTFDPFGYDLPSVHTGRGFRQYLRGFLTAFDKQIQDGRIACIGH